MRHRLTAAVVLAVAITSGSGCTPSMEELAASQNPYPESSTLHAPMDRMLRKLATDKNYLELARETVKEGGNLQDRNIKLAVEGMRALDDDALQTQIEIVAQILGKASDRTCAQLAFPTPGKELDTGKLLLGQLENLPQDQVDAWFDVSYQAAAAGIARKPPLPQSPLMAEAGMKRIASGLSDDGKYKLGRTISQGWRASDEDKCWAARILFNRTLKLPDKERAAVVRSLVAPAKDD